ncbi:MAG TPA: hypothetical protein VGJ72_01335 [Polaromonas sp.]
MKQASQTANKKAPARGAFFIDLPEAQPAMTTFFQVNSHEAKKIPTAIV